jgi:hypothetical protein
VYRAGVDVEEPALVRKHRSERIASFSVYVSFWPKFYLRSRLISSEHGPRMLKEAMRRFRVPVWCFVVSDDKFD